MLDLAAAAAGLKRGSGRNVPSIGADSDLQITPRGNHLDTLCGTLEKKMQFAEGERDIVMCVEPL